MKQLRQTVRIIAGCWRSRKIFFTTRNGVVRPTPDRVRETLFNWLAADIVGANCLDLYAGSGALSFEALSRGANSVVAVEKDATVCADILATTKLFGAALTLVQRDVTTWLAVGGRPFDIVFLDPPYQEDALPNCFQQLHNNGWVRKGSLIYYEHKAAIMSDALPQNWEIIKSAKAGRVYYYLARVKN